MLQSIYSIQITIKDFFLRKYELFSVVSATVEGQIIGKCSKNLVRKVF